MGEKGKEDVLSKCSVHLSMQRHGRRLRLTELDLRARLLNDFRRCDDAVVGFDTLALPHPFFSMLMCVFFVT